MLSGIRILDSIPCCHVGLLAFQELESDARTSLARCLSERVEFTTDAVMGWRGASVLI